MIFGEQFHSPSKGKMSLEKVVEEILAFTQEEPKQRYKIVVGTDSEVRKKTDFVTAIVIHRIGRGGRYFWKRTYKDQIPVLRNRIYEEVGLSIGLAQEMLRKLGKNIKVGNLVKEMEIHVDVGRNGQTREMIKEVVGMVRGNGFNAKIKPESYGASKVADKHI